MNLKIAAIAAVLIGGSILGWKVNGWRHDAAQLETLRAQVERARQELVAAEGRAAREREESRNVSLRLSRIRSERDRALDELDSRPTLTRTITEVVREDCPVCACDALGADFRLLYNRAGTGSADTEATPPGGGNGPVREPVPAPGAVR